MPRHRSSRRLFLESLESRRLLAITVTTLQDQNDPIGSSGPTSLREAIARTNLDFDGTINFAPELSGGTIRLNSDLVIEKDVAIIGPGANQLTIDANGSKRIFTVTDGPDGTPSVEFRGLKLSGAFTGDPGGAIYSVGSNILVRDSWIADNVSGANGGGIAAVAGGTLGSLTVIGSTFSGNSSLRSGGAISVVGTPLSVTNSTISGNRADDQGGGIHVSLATVRIVNTTIALNRADADGANDAGSDLGGGISRGGGDVLLQNSIVIGNLRGRGSISNDVDGLLSPETTRTLIGHAASAGGVRHGVKGNIVGNNGTGFLTPSTVINTVLAVNGGAMPTHDLVVGSLAIDAGTNVLAVDNSGSNLLKDQRGIRRIVDGDANGTTLVDMGALEFARPPVINLAGSISYTEQGPAKLIAPTATVTDPDSRRLGGGRLVVSIAGAVSTDRLAIRHQGTAAGQIGVSGQQITFGGVVIGTRLGGNGVAPLRVNLNGSSTVAAAQALVRNVTFRNISDTPPTAPRNITFVLTDETGLSSLPKHRTLTIIAVAGAQQEISQITSPSKAKIAATAVPSVNSTTTSPPQAIDRYFESL